MRDVVILGAPRSGLRLLAGVLSHSERVQGPVLVSQNAETPATSFEPNDAYRINEAIIGGSLPRRPTLAAGEHWLAASPMAELQITPEIAFSIARATQSRPLCLIDPRFSHTLPAWKKHLEGAVRVCLFRDPVSTAESIVEMCEQNKRYRHLSIDFQKATRIWMAAYEKVIGSSRHQEEWLFLHVDQLFTRRGLDRLQTTTMRPVQRGLTQWRMMRSWPSRPIPNRARKLFEELCTLAEFPCHGLPKKAESARRRTHKQPQMSVIISTDQPRTALQETIEALDQQECEPGLFEVLIIDGCTASTAESTITSRCFGRTIQWIPRHPNEGLSTARNRALHRAKGAFILFLRDDGIAKPDLISTHMQAHRDHEHGRVAILGSTEHSHDRCNHALSNAADDPKLGLTPQTCEAGVRYGWMRFHLQNLSIHRKELQSTGSFDPRFSKKLGSDMDMGYRLWRHGVQGMGVPAARIQLRSRVRWDELRTHTVQRATEWSSFFAKHPPAMDHPAWRWIVQLSRSAITSIIDEKLPDIPRILSELDSIGDVNVGVFKNADPAGSALAQEIVTRARRSLLEIGQIWWLRGLYKGLEHLDIAQFSELFAQHESADKNLSRTVVAAPQWEDRPSWMIAIRHWQETGAPDRLVLLTDPEHGFPLGRVAENIVAAGLSLQENIDLIEPGALPDQWSPILHTAKAVLQLRGRRSDYLARLATAQSVPTISLPPSAKPVALFPLATERVVRILAWPDFWSQAELEMLMGHYVPILAGRNDLCLCLRINRDLAPTDALARLHAAHQRYAYPDDDIEVLLIENANRPIEWRPLGYAVSAVIELPSSVNPVRRPFFDAIDSPVVSSPSELAVLLREKDQQLARANQEALGKPA